MLRCVRGYNFCSSSRPFTIGEFDIVIWLWPLRQHSVLEVHVPKLTAKETHAYLNAFTEFMFVYDDVGLLIAAEQKLMLWSGEIRFAWNPVDDIDHKNTRM